MTWMLSRGCWTPLYPLPSGGTSGGVDGQALVHASFANAGASAQLTVSSQMPEAYPFTVGYEAYFERGKLVFHETNAADGEVEANLTSYTSEGKTAIPVMPNNPYEKKPAPCPALFAERDHLPAIIAICAEVRGHGL
ncbi:hypothetical protein ACFSQ7_23445 [Paenibacillus rhizoplanae]